MGRTASRLDGNPLEAFVRDSDIKAGGLGDYCFVIYAEAHVGDELMADTLRALHAKQGAVKFLGSYPAAGEHASTAREHADARWRSADDWVAALRSRIIG